MSNFLQRAITGILFVAFLIGGIWWDHKGMFSLFFLIVGLGTWEFLTLAKKSSTPHRVIGTLTALVGITGTYLWILSGFETYKPLLLLFPLLSIPLFIELFNQQKNPFTNVAYTWMGTFYLLIPFALLLFLGIFPGNDIQLYYHSENVLGFLFLIWANDTGAYLTGRQFGKHKLFERVSPKKTWEGFAGGVLICLGVAFAISHYFDALSLTDWLVLSLIVAVFGNIGDLVESRFKRSIDVKDSGKILPGHGGILDRFDGVLIAAPWAVFYLLMTH